MRRTSVTFCWIVFGAAALVACSKKPTELASKAKSPAVQSAPATPIQDDPNAAALHGTRKLKNLDLPVYVDGAQKGVLRFGDLPAIANVGTDFAPEYRLADYLAAIGVAPASVKSVFFYDATSRIASVEGTELTKQQDRFRFNFGSGTTGVAETGWETTGLKNTFIVHEIRKVAVFVAKDAPKIDKNRQCVLTPGGDCAEDVPYMVADAVKGTRVYVDGKLAGAVKRKMISDAIAIGETEDGKKKLSLVKLGAQFGADMSGVQAVELVSGDDVVGRADAMGWAKVSDEVYFTLAQHQHGKVTVRVPASMQADASVDRDALVTSIHIFKSSTPKGKELVSISDLTDLSAQLASNDDAQDDDTKQRAAKRDDKREEKN